MPDLGESTAHTLCRVERGSYLPDYATKARAHTRTLV